MTLESDGETKCYQVSTAKRNTFARYAIFFFAWSLLNAYRFYVRGPAECTDFPVALIGVGFWFALTLLGVYLYASAYRYRLRISKSKIRKRGLFREHVARVSQVDELTWRIRPSGGSIQLQGSFGVMKVEAGNFPLSDRQEVITFFRENVDEARQIDWSKFENHYSPEPQIVLAQRETERQLFQLMANLVLVTGVAALVNWFILPRVSIAPGAVMLLFGGIEWIATRRPATTGATTTSLVPTEAHSS